MINTLIWCLTIFFMYIFHCLVKEAKQEKDKEVKLAKIGFLTKLAEFYEENFDKFTGDGRVEVFSKMIDALNNAEEEFEDEEG